ncbi:glutathione S-transferase family protein [Aquibium sp. LZ166]|uniref:Glutathione S-transferase family protein n=1 Tax=Aquibium pacificus TaxID=3153579 RepID=A0ABV3SIT2_9HYPH
MLTFYHAPWSRSSGVFWLLEELGVDYSLEIVDIRAKGGVAESYRAIQPNKKVPAIVHDGVTVTERAAICIHLADAFPEAGLAPAIGDPRRGPYLTWLVYCDSVFDPAIAARAHGLTYRSNDYSFGLFDDIVGNLERHLSANEFAAGDRFTAADTQLASGISFTMNILKVLPDKPVFQDYLARATGRPAYARVQAKDAELARLHPWEQNFG